MKKTIISTVIAIILIAGCVILGNSLYTVHQKEFVAVRQFGKIVKVESEPGLKLITPFVQSTQRINAATKLYDIPSSDVLTSVYSIL